MFAYWDSCAIPLATFESVLRPFVQIHAFKRGLILILLGIVLMLWFKSVSAQQSMWQTAYIKALNMDLQQTD